MRLPSLRDAPMAAWIAMLPVLRQPWPHHLCLFLFVGFFRCLSLSLTPSLVLFCRSFHLSVFLSLFLSLSEGRGFRKKLNTASLHPSVLVGLQLHCGVRAKLVPRACALGHLCNHFSKIDVQTSSVNFPRQCLLEYPILPAQDPNNAFATVLSSSCHGHEPKNQKESHTFPASSSWTSLLVCFQNDPQKNVCI